MCWTMAFNNDIEYCGGSGLDLFTYIDFYLTNMLHIIVVYQHTQKPFRVNQNQYCGIYHDQIIPYWK